MKLIKIIVTLLLSLVMLLSSIPFSGVSAASKTIDDIPEYPDSAFVEISKCGVKAKFGQEYKNLADTFVIDLSKKPVDISEAETVEFDIYIENYNDFKSAYQGRSLSFNLSSNASNKLQNRTFCSIYDYITQSGWNHIEIPLSSVNTVNTNLNNITFTYLNSSGGTDYNKLGNIETNFVNICATRTAAKIDLVYGDNMIFQQNKPFDITGEGIVGVTVKAELISASKKVVRTGTTVVGKNGKWTLTLDAMTGGYDAYKLKIYLGSSETKTLQNIRFGEVFVASGQSNMQYKLWETERGAEMYKNNSYNQPNISICLQTSTVNSDGLGYYPEKNFKECQWILGNDREISDVSAVAYYFAEKLQAKLNVPVGVMDISLGSTSIFAWISREHIENDKALLTYLKDSKKYYNESNWGDASTGQTMSALYNTLTYNCAGLKAAGMIWYQGCNEVGTPEGVYENALKVLRKCYADTFKYDGDMPFVLAHLAPYGYSGDSLPKMWDEMTNATLNNANMGQVTIYDLPVDWDYSSFVPSGKGSNPHPIHPLTKEPIGVRMAEIMYSMIYDNEYGETNTPIWTNKTIDGKYIYVDFKNVGEGLASTNGNQVKGFSIAGVDGVFVNAKAEIVDHDTVKVWSDVLAEPKNIAYAYDRYAITSNLYSKQNGELFLPAAPFISTKKVTRYAANTSWYDVDDNNIIHFESNEFESSKAWTANGATAEIVSDVKDYGTGSLKISYSGDSETFRVSPSFVRSNGNNYIDFERNYTDYKSITFKVKNTGDNIILDEMSILSGSWYHIDLNKELSSDSDWINVTADFTKLIGPDGKTYDYSVLNKVTNIRIVFSGAKSDGAVYLDTFQLAPNFVHVYMNSCDSTCEKCGAKRTVKHTYKTVITKATTSKNGKKEYKCVDCGYVASSSTTIRRIYSVKLSATSYTYNGKTKKPTVTVKDTAGKKLSSSYYTVTYASGRKNVGTYKVTVKFKGNYSGTKTLTFKINPVKTGISKLTAGKKSLKVYVTKKTSQVTGYQIQYSTSKSFKSYKTKTISSYKTTSTTLSKLSAKKTYYVRVRTYKTVSGKKYYSGWSSYKYKKTK